MPERHVFLYKIQPVRHEMLTDGATAEEDQIISAHFSYLEGLTQAGVVHLAGRTLTAEYSGFGIVLLSAESEEAARRLMDDDPAVERRVMRAELYPFRVSLLGTVPGPD